MIKGLFYYDCFKKIVFMVIALFCFAAKKSETAAKLNDNEFYLMMMTSAPYTVHVIELLPYNITKDGASSEIILRYNKGLVASFVYYLYQQYGCCDPSFLAKLFSYVVVEQDALAYEYSFNNEMVRVEACTFPEGKICNGFKKDENNNYCWPPASYHHPDVSVIKRETYSRNYGKLLKKVLSCDDYERISFVKCGRSSSKPGLLSVRVENKGGGLTLNWMQDSFKGILDRFQRIDQEYQLLQQNYLQPLKIRVWVRWINEMEREFVSSYHIPRDIKNMIIKYCDGGVCESRWVPLLKSSYHRIGYTSLDRWGNYKDS
ncbi:MAG: hypothetical protein WBQ73_01385 [Candidatus Babeliales bacterium]